ncbi:hypothetical protein RvY_03347 [Ramazzottius varieornatus]|uniref:Uncharacterized protein n=1 Tax=Ramazzottius varieornatus TaxID=947166 RepID=A0A1D1UMQ3_RAMVA|nr:hypothetical protein RvY_03347 [Ramazzottius varieornatus]
MAVRVNTEDERQRLSEPRSRASIRISYSASRGNQRTALTSQRACSCTHYTNIDNIHTHTQRQTQQAYDKCKTLAIHPAILLLTCSLDGTSERHSALISAPTSSLTNKTYARPCSIMLHQQVRSLSSAFRSKRPSLSLTLPWPTWDLLPTVLPTCNQQDSAAYRKVGHLPLVILTPSPSFLTCTSPTLAKSKASLYQNLSCHHSLRRLQKVDEQWLSLRSE